MERSLRINVNTLYLMGFFHSFLVVTPIFVPLLQGYGLSMAEVMQTQAMFAFTVAVLEVPSGYIADLWGRRRAMLLGSAINAAGYVSLMQAQSFGDFLFCEFLLGVGISLISGADVALLYDSESQLAAAGDETANPSRGLSRLIAIEAGASGVAGIVASLLFAFGDMGLLLAVQAACGFIPLLLGCLLTEAPRPLLAQAHRGHAVAILGVLLKGSPVVLWTSIAIVAFGLLAMYAYWIYQKYWEVQGIPVGAFGYIWAAFALSVSVTARYSGALEAWLGWRRLLWATALLPLAGILGMAVFSGWVGVLFGFAIQLSRGISLTLFYEALNRRIAGDYRATVNSLVSLGLRALFIVTGPLMGWALDLAGVSSTLLGLALVFTPLLILVVLALVPRIGRDVNEEAVPELPALEQPDRATF
ncbi:MAG: MFS transporter [Pseudomonadota bacterium]